MKTSKTAQKNHENATYITHHHIDYRYQRTYNYTACCSIINFVKAKAHLTVKGIKLNRSPMAYFGTWCGFNEESGSLNFVPGTVIWASSIMFILVITERD